MATHSSVLQARRLKWVAIPFSRGSSQPRDGTRFPALQAHSLPTERIHLQCRRPWFHSLVGKIRWRRDRLPTPVFLSFSGGSDGKESTCNWGDLVSIPGLRRSPGGGHGNPLQYSCLENPHGQRSLASYSPWGHKESDMIEQLNTR